MDLFNKNFLTLLLCNKNIIIIEIQIFLREGKGKVAPYNFGDFLWETSGLQKHLTTIQKTPKL